mgnify:CR=1 FL=1
MHDTASRHDARTRTQKHSRCKQSHGPSSLSWRVSNEAELCSSPGAFDRTTAALPARRSTRPSSCSPSRRCSSTRARARRGGHRRAAHRRAAVPHAPPAHAARARPAGRRLRGADPGPPARCAGRSGGLGQDDDARRPRRALDGEPRPRRRARAVGDRRPRSRRPSACRARRRPSGSSRPSATVPRHAGAPTWQLMRDSWRPVPTGGGTGRPSRCAEELAGGRSRRASS